MGIFALQMLWGDGQPVMAASRMGAEIPNRVFAGDWWRLFSVMLLHANFAHLAMNMLALLSFGPFLERLMGSGRYLVLYVLAGLGGSLLSLTRGGEGIGVGASGGIWGLMVAGAVAVTWPRGLLPASLALQMRQRAWGPVVINLFYSLQPGIDMRAHVGGGIAGGLLVLALTRGGLHSGPLQPSRVINLLAAIVALLLCTSMGIALNQGRPWDLTGPWKLEPVALGNSRVSLSVPGGMELTHADKSRIWHFGDFNAEGVEVIVLVTDPIAAEADVSHPLDDMIIEMEKGETGFHYGQKPKIVTLPSARDVVFAEMIPDDKNDVRFVWLWWSVEKDHRWVRVATNALNSTSSARRKQLTAIADSVVCANSNPAPGP